jgi:hypothetical protein
VFLKRHIRRKDGKEHVDNHFAKVSDLVRRDGTIQRWAFNLGDLNTTEIERRQRSIEVMSRKARLGSIGF